MSSTKHYGCIGGLAVSALIWLLTVRGREGALEEGAPDNVLTTVYSDLAVKRDSAVVPDYVEVAGHDRRVSVLIDDQVRDHATTLPD